jgi:hypothetical protein
MHNRLGIPVANFLKRINEEEEVNKFQTLFSTIEEEFGTREKGKRISMIYLDSS